jgi:hypothetical protein
VPFVPDTFSGKIVDVKINSQTKKVEALSVEIKEGAIYNRNVRVDDRTRFEYSGIFNKEDHAPRIGFNVNVKLRAESDVADQLKISPATAKAGKKKSEKQ